MNYRHAFHAGNFADVIKHAVLARILVHLRLKNAPFRAIDTHAGAGLYDLTGDEATRGGEWREGINRLFTTSPQPDIADLLAPYLEAVAAQNPDGALKRYPGSPLIVRAALRTQDRLIACELEPNAAAALRHSLRGDARAKSIEIDGWTALGAYVPPKERRGFVLIDPPFEQPGEFARLADMLATAHRKWPGGIYLAWYPMKDEHEYRAFGRKLQQLAIPKILRAEIILPPIPESTRLRGSGLMIVNPPWTLEAELALLLPALGAILSDGGQSTIRLDWLAGEK
jgi:23S rRNA (adenine2030-N6)-methyltransferase